MSVPDTRVVHLDDFGEVPGQELLVATGRAPRVSDIGLERLGIEPDPTGLEVDGRCRVADGVWAVGDVTGVMPFTHVGMCQGRIVAADVAGKQPRSRLHGHPARRLLRPRSRRSRSHRSTSPRAGDRTHHRERQVLIGAWAVGPMAGEWIHYAALAIQTATPLAVLRDTVARFPTFTEAYLTGVEQLDPGRGMSG